MRCKPGVLLAFTLLLSAGPISAQTEASPPPTASATGDVTIRTENYARPPYSGATYFFYERGTQVICTKLEVCNKYGDCTTTYKKGLFKEDEDTEPFEKSGPFPIAPEKLKKHRCLTKYGLVK